jgi:hypothetical protein
MAVKKCTHTPSQVSADQLVPLGILAVLQEKMSRLMQYKKLLPEPEHPILAALLSAIVERLSRYIELVISLELELHGRLKGSRESAQFAEQFAEGRQLVSELKELITWFAGPLRPLSEEKITTFSEILAEVASESGFSFATISREIRNLERLAYRRPKGRPAKQRPLAVSALEMQQANPKLSWNALARKLCPPGRENNFQWREALRQEVNALKKVLRKYQIPF